MKIRIDPHTLERAEDRGATEEEIQDVLENGEFISAKRDRLMKAKVYPYGRKRLENFTSKSGLKLSTCWKIAFMVTVTVYVYYGLWEDRR